jgi:peptide/nickel transport system permease protein
MATHELPAAVGVGVTSAAKQPEEERRGGPTALRAWLGNRQARIGVGVIVALAAFCYLGPLLYHTNQVTAELNSATLPPGAGHPLGTDGYGYDVLGRLMVGGQSSLELGCAVAVATTVIGTLYGAIAGWAGGIVDMVMMRVIDTLLAVPALAPLLILVNIFAPNLLMIIALLTALSWLGTARLVRGEVISLRSREYVQAAKAGGGDSWWIIHTHLVPNAFGVIIPVIAFNLIGGAIRDSLDVRLR